MPLRKDVTELSDDELLAQLRIDDERLKPNGAPKASPGRSTKAKKKTASFTKFPWAWEEKLRQARYISTYRVVLYVLRKWWQSRRQPVPVSNVALPDVSRYQKSKSLAELEALGLVKIKREPRKSPLVTPLKVG
jgi:hypothetical protein